ncbi:hypothetical protein AVEN_242248-1 [Araneus ventricosus]|uniref:Uncharacterized protein n=1 Tax=Araneus ventricosus TaxID=182803 RepID=A0A4Y2LFV0_ARAVE|nr:hypothetical protein AVEN_242248-1 [Araneus ventricosus]
MRIGAACSKAWISKESEYPTAPFRLPATNAEIRPLQIQGGSLALEEIELEITGPEPHDRLMATPVIRCQISGCQMIHSEIYTHYSVFLFLRDEYHLVRGLGYREDVPSTPIGNAAPNCACNRALSDIYRALSNRCPIATTGHLSTAILLLQQGTCGQQSYCYNGAPVDSSTDLSG